MQRSARRPGYIAECMEHPAQMTYGIPTYLGRLARCILILALLARAALWLLGSYFIARIPLDGQPLESKMVYLAREVQFGRSLYPDWTHYPYETNFFGPVYFALTGFAGRALHLDGIELRTLGRLISFASVAVLCAVVLAYTRRSTGSFVAGVVAGMTLLTSRAVLAGSQMARPDALAGACAMLGFLILVHRPGPLPRMLAVIMLSLGVLTKQTAIVPGVSALLWLWATGRRKTACGLLLAWIALAGGIALAVTLLWEPRCLVDLFGESGSAFSFEGGWQNIRQACAFMPELCLATVIFMIGSHWKDRHSPLRFLILAAVAWDTATSCKTGASYNYFVDFATAGAMATGMLWKTLNSFPSYSGAQPRRRSSIVWGNAAYWTVHAALVASLIQPSWMYLKNVVTRWHSYAHAASHQLNEIEQLARSPHEYLLTDSPYLAYNSFHTPPFVDAWLFRQNVIMGRIQPAELIQKIDQRQFDVVVTTHDLAAPSYLDYDLGFPPIVVDHLRRNYVFEAFQAGVFVYRPTK